MALLHSREHYAIARFVLEERTNALDDDVDECVAAMLQRVLATRYVARPSTYRHREGSWGRCIVNRWLTNATEFLEHFRVTRK
ncbi:TPA: hypothetical protein N0F65_007885 [Lagenidium giganteum]|uniref:Uncharacterized protein n=1 Tax=Lagenidium giganteum TaxID=4803 RepID=A0AAV2Z1S2_9STRA|nr:TPA: hypothetical protein N0F65_007885 [Lagenidium giganteum]